MTEACECPRGYRFPEVVISYAVYLCHRFLLSYRDVQGLLFKRGVDVSYETVRACCVRFGPDPAEALRHRKPRRGQAWHLDEMRVAMDVLRRENRDTGAAKRFFRRLIDDQGIPERVVSDGLRSYGAAIRETPELDTTEHVTVSAAERQNNLIGQSHRPTRDQERQQRGSRTVPRTQALLFTHAEVGDLRRDTRARTPAQMRRRDRGNAFRVWDKLSLSLP